MSSVRDNPPPYEAVAFDCDSTLSAIEGIDELAREHMDQIASLTDAAMSGEVPLESVYKQRLEIVRPTRQAVEAVGELYVERALPHVAELVAALHHLGKRVYVISGGVLGAVRILARHLEVPEERVHAVDLRHDDDGAYLGFDEDSPLARNGGKPEIVAALNEPSIALVGDGTSDLEAAPYLSRFVAFGGVANRESVRREAKCHCAIADFAALLPLLCTREEIATLEELPAHAALVSAASTLSPSS